MQLCICVIVTNRHACTYVYLLILYIYLLVAIYAERLFHLNTYLEDDKRHVLMRQGVGPLTLLLVSLGELRDRGRENSSISLDDKVWIGHCRYRG